MLWRASAACQMPLDHDFGQLGRGRDRTHTQGGAALFLWLWLVISIGNSLYGVLRAGIPVVNEIGAFVPIFAIPGLLAWYLAYRYGAAR